MVSKKNVQKKSKKQVKTSGPSRDYLPRQGTLPGKIFQWLNARPMLFAELSDNARRETKLEGDDLASQLSAALYDLCARGVVVRIDPTTRKIVPSKGARGALYGLEVKTRSLFRTSLNGAASAPAKDEPRQLDLSGFAKANGMRSAAGRPASMPEVMYSNLMAQRAVAEKQVAAIDALLATWG